MRLRTFGLAMMVMSFGGLSYGQANAAKQSTASLLGGTPDPASVLAHGNTFGGNDTLFQPPLSDSFSDQSGIARPEGGRTRLALATPAIVQRNSPAALTSPPVVDSYTADSSMADSYSAQPQEQQPSLWLMGGVILVLLGYQLRRKHRFLRPHRFNAL